MCINFMQDAGLPAFKNAGNAHYDSFIHMQQNPNIIDCSSMPETNGMEVLDRCSLSVDVTIVIMLFFYYKVSCSFKISSYFSKFPGNS